jgi:hypothetical protein
VQDFRSEDGLYSLIQAQYDKSLENPPWEQANTFDIDDRPKKRKRPSYFYEVVAPDGNVVGVIDEEQAPTSPKHSSPEPKSTVLLPSSSPLSTRSTTPSIDLSDLDHSTQQTLRSQSSIGSTTSESDTSEKESQDVDDADGAPLQSTSNDSIIVATECVRSRKTSPITSPFQDSPYENAALPERRSKRGLRSKSPLDDFAEKNESFTSTFQRKPLPGTRRHTIQTEESSFISSTSSSDDDLPATQSSQSSRTSLPNMKGRDLFDSMIWTDPFTTSIFYMFISSLRQKIQNEVKSTTEAHDFIRVLRDGGRLVRNYTQNIDWKSAWDSIQSSRVGQVIVRVFTPNTNERHVHATSTSSLLTMEESRLSSSTEAWLTLGAGSVGSYHPGMRKKEKKPPWPVKHRTARRVLNIMPSVLEEDEED